MLTSNALREQNPRADQQLQHNNEGGARTCTHTHMHTRAHAQKHKARTHTHTCSQMHASTHPKQGGLIESHALAAPRATRNCWQLDFCVRGPVA